ncbi:unnamed protein product [Ranitomeya imitator]|uniref:Chromo domain-containing protein n=1 Tax=Ranitomeya imitator TaxID=111125 RepID=A0ABN9LCS8_9NEOB|nr:unnamed protein product [Ranitomeya imitator]
MTLMVEFLHKKIEANAAEIRNIEAQLTSAGTSEELSALKVRGTAMGSNVVRPYANAYMAHFEESIINYLSPAHTGTFLIKNRYTSTRGILLSVHFQRFGQRRLRRRVFLEIWTNVRHNLKEANRRSKKYFDKKRREALFAVGDMKVGTPDKEAMPTVPPVDEDGEFDISRILDSRWHRGRLQYLVSWKDFGPEDNSWEKAEDVSASRLIKAFYRRFTNKARPRGS